MVNGVRWPWSRRERHTFDSPPKPIDQLILQMLGRVSNAPVSRADALSVPAVTQGRNAVTVIATLPLVELNSENQPIDSALLRQIDPDVPNVVTLAQTVEDLVFDSISWWLVTATDFAGFPVAARHLDVGSVSIEPPAGNTHPLPSGLDPRNDRIVWVEGRPVAGSRVIRFDAPNPPIRKVGGRAIRRAILLDQAAATYAATPSPLDFFSPAEGADEIDDNEVSELLAKWQAQRRDKGTAYVPAALKYNSVDSPSPHDLQLVELQRQVGVEIANLFGLDSEDLGVSTTSRTYANVQDRRLDRINEVLAPYMRAITDRLSMGDVTRQGHSVRFDLNEFMQGNAAQRVAFYQGMQALDAITVEEIRRAEGLPPMAETGTGSDATAGPGTASRELQLVEQIQKIYLGVGVVVTEREAREILNRSGAGLDLDVSSSDAAGGGTQGPEPAAPPQEEPDQVDASRPAAHTFDDDGDTHTFADLPVTGFSVDRGKRTIEGTVVPFGPVGAKGGLRLRFRRGALQFSDVGRVKLMFPRHTEAVGRATVLKNTRQGLFARFKVGRGPEGDRALMSAEDGVFDGFSVGIDFDVARDTSVDADGETLIVNRADLRHVALTDEPVFDDARVTAVAASRDNERGHDVPDDPEDKGTQDDAPGKPDEPEGQAGLALSEDQLTALLSRPGAIQALVTAQQRNGEPGTPQGALVLSPDQVDGLIKGGQFTQLLGLPATKVDASKDDEPEKPEKVDPTRKVTMSVTEPAPYTFDGSGNIRSGSHDFSSDLVAAGRDRDDAAQDRALSFLEAHFARRMFSRGRHEFAVNTTGVAALNPDIQRPDLYVDQLEFVTPLWTALNTGTLENVTPFVVPKFASSSGLVSDHTEGIEPTPGALTATSQTITPTALSGKVEITREAWDQGGNPQLSTILFRQIEREWFEELESAIATFLVGLAGVTAVTLTTGGADAALTDEVVAALAGIQFARGGFRYDNLYTHVDLYKRLVAAKDADGRKLLPVIGPNNAVGTTRADFGRVQIGAVNGVPTWALGATDVNEFSFLINPADVTVWASAPQRLQFETRVSHVDVGVWGYKALAALRADAVRRFLYKLVP